MHTFYHDSPAFIDAIDSQAGNPMNIEPSHSIQYKIPTWPQMLIDRYLELGYWNNDTFDKLINEIADKFKNNTALVFNQQRVTYKDLVTRATQLAFCFCRLNLKKGDVVILHLSNSATYVETLFALFIAGIVPVFALPAHRENEILSFVRATQAKAYIGQMTLEGESLETLRQALVQDQPDIRLLTVKEGESLFDTLSAAQAPAQPLPQNQPDDLACFQLSGGTTGIPKLIPRCHRDYLCNIRAAVQACRFSADTVYLVVLPMGHNFPLACPGFIGTLLAGGRVVITDKNYPDCCFSLIQQESVTVTALVPPLAMVWLDAAELYQPILSSLKVLQVGGAKMSHAAALRVQPVLGCTLQQVFGMAEGLICFTQPDDKTNRALTTQGQPMTAGDEIRVVDEQGQEVPRGEMGYLLTRGPYTIRGYYGPAGINTGAFDHEGFYRSGDLVRYTTDGDIISEGRDKDQINRGGEKIDCGELEDILLRHPGVQDAAVVGIQDDYLGECTCAFILSPSDAPTPVALRQFLINQGIASFKIPDRFSFPASFDLTGVGKISKKMLRARLKQDYLLNMENK